MVINLERVYTYSEIVKICVQLKNTYSELIKLLEIGTSSDGRPIFLLEIGKGTKGPLYISGVHGRESINPTVLIYIIKDICEKYYSYKSNLLNEHKIGFVPVINPDGYVIATEGYEAINLYKLKNKLREVEIPYYEYKFNANIVDINRNFPCKSFVNTEFSGECGKEPETKAIIDLFKNSDFEITGFVDIHSRGNTIYYKRKAMKEEYNIRQFEVAMKLSQLSGYPLCLRDVENPDGFSGGNTVNYVSEYHKIPAITIETVDEDAKFPLDNAYCKKVFGEIRKIPMMSIKIFEM